MQTKVRSKTSLPDWIKGFYIMSTVCFLSGVACPQNHTFERLFINVRAVLYGLAENYTQAFGPQKRLHFPIDPARTASQNKWIQHNIIHAGFNFDRSHSWASTEPKPNRSSLFSDHADARPSARCISPSRSLPNHTDDLEINITEISMLFSLK